MNTNKLNRTTWDTSMHNWKKYLAKNLLLLLITLKLTTQVAGIEAFNNVTQADNEPNNQTQSTIEIFTSVQNISIEGITNTDIKENYHELAMFLNNTLGFSEVDKHDLYVKISRLLRQEVLDQFDVISEDLHELSDKIVKNESTKKSIRKSDHANLSHLFRFIRSPPINESNTCEVEQTLLINFRNELLVTLNGTNQADSNNCPLDITTDTCDELIKLVLCGYNYLKNGFELSTKNSVAVNESKMWQKKLEEYKEKSTKLLDDKVASLSQKYNLEISNLKTDMHELQSKANLYFKTIQKDGLEVCSYRIVNGDIEGATEKFRQLKDEFEGLEGDMIRSILKIVYKLERVENIIKFIKKINTVLQCSAAYPALYDIMESNGDLNSPLMILFSYAIPENTLCYNSGIIHKLYLAVNNINEAWAYKILSASSYIQINEFVSKYASEFRKNLDKLIHKAYFNNLGNVKNILRFIRDLPYIRESIVGLNSLYQKMKNNNHLDSYEILMLAYRIKEHMDMSNYFNVDLEYRNMFTALKNSLPRSVMRIIWHGSRCTIKNKLYNEYLYCADHKFDEERGKIFTWIPDDGEFSRGYWDLQTEDNAQEFTIRCILRNRYIFSSGHINGCERRWVFTWIPGVKDFQGYWKLKPIYNGEYFTIYNTVYDEYLFADGDMIYAENKDRRGVFAWRSRYLDSNKQREIYWTINC